ncbi:MAG: hypothetical protein ABL958_07860 [Bdellovibrionia bacterium]
MQFLRNLLFVLVIHVLLTSSANAETPAVNFTLATYRKGRPIKVKWNPPELLTSSIPFEIQLSGAAPPGVVMNADNRKPTIPSFSGSFEVRYEIQSSEFTTEIQFISPRGDSVNYVFTIDVPDISNLDQVNRFRRSKPLMKQPSPEFSIPMKFGLEQNGVSIAPQAFDFVLYQNSAIRLGRTIIRDNPIEINGLNDNLFEFSWPPILMRQGEISIRNELDTPIWSQRLAEQQILNLGPKNREKTSTSNQKFGYRASLTDVKGEPIMTSNQKVVICLETTVSLYCTQPYSYDHKKRQFSVERNRSETEPQAWVNGKLVERKGITPLAEENLRIEFKLPDRSRWKFSLSRIKIDYRDIVLSEDKRFVKVSGGGKNPEDLFVEIAEREWSLTVSVDDPVLFFTNEQGIPIRQDLVFQSTLPEERLRPWLHKDTLDGSYLLVTDLFGQTNQDLKGQNTEIVLLQDRKFVWKYAQETRGKHSRRTFDGNFGDQKVSAYHEMYRGFPFELSLRLTGIISQETQWLFGEAALGAWAENLFGWKHPTFSDRRWGMNLRHVASLHLSGNDPGFTSANLDIKYRFSRGLWNKDETIGAVFGIQDMAFKGNLSGTLPARMFGVGAFWARSMPKFFNDILDIIPWFHFPKWVDMEGMYYLGSDDSRVSLGQGNYNLTFHGKMFFRPEFFMEASFGAKGFNYVRDANQANVTLFFLTCGLGFNF